MASDVCAGNLTGEIVVGGDTVDTNTVGTYIITYNVTDTEGNTADEATRTVNVVDTIQPYVSAFEVESELTMLVTFSKEMGTGVLDSSNYTSGAGIGTFALNPDSVEAVTGRIYRLAWSCPSIMLNGGDITVTVDSAVEDINNNVITSSIENRYWWCFSHTSYYNACGNKFGCG